MNAKDGSILDFTRIPPKEERSLDMAYMTGMSEGWYALLNEETNIGWAVSYPVEVFKYLWYWRNYGGGYGYPVVVVGRRGSGASSRPTPSQGLRPLHVAPDIPAAHASHRVIGLHPEVDHLRTRHGTRRAE